jgi:zinc protease
MTSVPCTHAANAAQVPDAWNWPALAIERRTLANGLRVILAERHTVPLVFLSWASQAGFESDPAGFEGLASLVPLLPREGTAHRDGGRITQELDDLGADLAVGSDWDCAFLNMGLLSCDLAAGAELLLDMACAAKFPHTAVTGLRQRRLIEMDQRRRDPRAIANDVFARALFGDTVYGRSPLGTAATVQRIDAAQIAAFHDAHYRPANSFLVVAGSFDSEIVADRLGSFELPAALGRLPSLPLPAGPAFDARGGVRLVDVPHAPQTEIRVGHGGIARDTEQLSAVEVCNAILGGGPESRLARSVRQHQGLTYDIRSRVTARRVDGTWIVETSVAHDAAGAALAGIRRDIDTLCEERMPASDVEQAKRRLFGAELRRFQDLIGIGATLGPAALQQEHADHFARRRDAIAAVEPDDVREAARRYLNPERLVTVVAGPAGALRSQLSSGGGGADARQPEPLESTS